MAEYDAFGREKGEDTLAGLGSSSPAASGRTVTPPAGPARTPTYGTGGPGPGFGARRTGSRLLKAVIAVVVLFVVGSIVSLVVGVVSTGVRTVNETRKAFDNLTIPSVSTPVPAATAPASAGSSLLRRDAFAQALGRLRHATATGPARSLRVDARRVSGQLSGPGGRLIFATATTSSTQTITTTGGAPTALRPIPLRAIDPAAPQRIAGALGARGDRVNYLVLTSIIGGPSWTAFSTRGRRYHADVHGRHVTRQS